MVALPLVFQTTEEWQDSDLGLHPSGTGIPELDGAIADYSVGTGWSKGAIALQDRIEAVPTRSVGKPAPQAETSEESCDHHLQLPLKGNVGTAYLDVFGSIYEVMQALRQ